MDLAPIPSPNRIQAEQNTPDECGPRSGPNEVAEPGNLLADVIPPVLLEARDVRFVSERFLFFHPSTDRRASVPQVDGDRPEQLALFMPRNNPDGEKHRADDRVLNVPSFEFHLSNPSLPSLARANLRAMRLCFGRYAILRQHEQP